MVMVKMVMVMMLCSHLYVIFFGGSTISFRVFATGSLADLYGQVIIWPGLFCYVHKHIHLQVNIKVNQSSAIPRLLPTCGCTSGKYRKTIQIRLTIYLHVYTHYTNTQGFQVKMRAYMHTRFQIHLYRKGHKILLHNRTRLLFMA